MMRKMMSAVVALSLMVGMVAVPTFAATATKTVADVNENLIVVNGIGTIVAKPDIAYIQVGYEAKNKEALVAQNEAKAKMQNIMKLIKAQGIKDADIKTQNVSLYKTADYNKEVKEEYYVATNSIEITVRNIDQVGKLIDEAVTGGSNQLGSVRFAVEDQDKFQLEALKLAVKNANNKAKAISDTIGVKISKPSKVTENSYNGGMVYREANLMSAKAADVTPVEVGTVNIEVNVSVEYRY